MGYIFSAKSEVFALQVAEHEVDITMKLLADVSIQYVFGYFLTFFREKSEMLRYRDRLFKYYYLFLLKNLPYEIPGSVQCSVADLKLCLESCRPLPWLTNYLH